MSKNLFKITAILISVAMVPMLTLAKSSPKKNDKKGNYTAKTSNSSYTKDNGDSKANADVTVSNSDGDEVLSGNVSKKSYDNGDTKLQVQGDGNSKTGTTTAIDSSSTENGTEKSTTITSTNSDGDEVASGNVSKQSYDNGDTKVYVQGSNSKTGNSVTIDSSSTKNGTEKSTTITTTTSDGNTKTHTINSDTTTSN